MIRRHTFRGKRYNIVQVSPCRIPKDRDGDIDPPNIKGKTIRLCKNNRPKRSMEVAVHEALHACFWDYSEDAVESAATDITKFLWRLGYRKI